MMNHSAHHHQFLSYEGVGVENKKLTRNFLDPKSCIYLRNFGGPKFLKKLELVDTSFA